MFKKISILVAVAVVALIARHANATAEVCGNGVDDDGNGLTDENCATPLVTGVCESPLSCGDTGMVSWSTGSLHYDLPPDIAPHVAYGPGIGLRRFVVPLYSPGAAGPTSVNHNPLGQGWGHTYMTWVWKYTDGGGINRIVLHTNQGRDVLYTDSGVCGAYECYTPQAGDHVLSMKSNTDQTFVQLLTGETLVYNSFGQLTQIQDTMTPTPNVVNVTWTGTSNGNVSTVTDASATRRLSFNYTNNLLTSVQFQIKAADGSWPTYHTTTYDYTNGVTRDATSQWFVPQTASEWTNLLIGSGIPNPTNQWNCQEASGNLADSIGTATLTAHNNGGMAYQQSVSGWSRKAVTLGDNTLSFWQSSTSICNPATTKCTTLGLVLPTILPTSYRDIFSMGDANGARALILNAGTVTHVLAMQAGWDGNFSAQVIANGTPVRPWVLSADPTNSFVQLMSDNRTITPAWATGTSANGLFTMGDLANGSGQCSFLYQTEWNGTSLTTAQMTTLISRIKNGAGLSSVTIGGQLAQKYVYDGSGFLTQIADGGGNQVAAFGYSSTTSGQVDLISTSRGTVGFEYNTSRVGCTAGGTVLYFNEGSTSSCNLDADCGSGYLCGGKTGTGSTGKCFLAARCLTLGNVNGETVVTAVAPLGPGGGSCSGACTDVMAYNWTGAGTGNINVIGREDPLANFSSVTYNSNGLATEVGYGDTDADPTNGGTNRVEYILYDSTFPGRIAEVRRQSDLSSGACDATHTAGCSRTLYSWGGTCGFNGATINQLCSVEQDGFTLDATGAVVTFSSKVTYKYDTLGRLLETDGPSTGQSTVLAYYSEVGTFRSNFLQTATLSTDSTHTLVPQITAYDFWGHGIALQDPNGKFTCDTYDSARGTLTSRRRAMAGQPSCATQDPTDITTSWFRDSWLRLTQQTNPDGACLFYTYTSTGQLSVVKRVDSVSGECGQGWAGDTQEYAYTPDAQVSVIYTYDSSHNLTAKQPFTYFASRRLQEIVNPADTSKFTGLVYDVAGKLAEVDGAGSLSRTVNHFAGAPGRDGRLTSVDEYKTSSTFDTWSLLYAWLGEQSQVTDGDGKITGSTRDDLSRLVKISSPDLGAPTLHVFDVGSRLTTSVEDLGGASQVTHAFGYDYMNRQTTADYLPRCPTGSTHATTQRYFDQLPTGVSCPALMANQCSNLKSHIAYIQQVILCSSSYSDGSLDQFTWYAYDDAGRVIEEYITDDAGRATDEIYTYTVTGSPATVSIKDVPSGLTETVKWTYGSGGNSDTDLVTSILVDSSTVIDTVLWFPFGPYKQYRWEATIGGTRLRNRVDRNLAYRISTVYGAEKEDGSSNNAQVALTEDAMGRVTSRVFSPAVTGLQSSYFTYDQQSRVTCESAASGACPTSGANLKNNHNLSPPFKNAGDWTQILRPIPGTSPAGYTNNFNTSGTTYGTSHQITDVNQSDGSPKFGHTAFSYNAYGNRVSDDNTTKLNDDARTYSYDGRHNVTNVRGQYLTGGVWHFYDVASGFDAKNRRVYKSFYDETTAKTATWFFYYDAIDRLTEVRYTPDVSVPGTYSTFDLVWLGNKLVLYWETDYPSGTTSRRYVTSDETNRPMQLWNWPSSGDATRIWAINPSAWGFDSNVLGSGIYQPMLFAGQYQDRETVAYENDGATIHRPGLALNGHRTYDPFLGSYIQMDPGVSQTWSSYVFVDSDPVANSDPLGLCGCSVCDSWGICCNSDDCFDGGGGGNGGSTGGTGGRSGGKSAGGHWGFCNGWLCWIPCNCSQPFGGDEGPTVCKEPSGASCSPDSGGVPVGGGGGHGGGSIGKQLPGCVDPSGKWTCGEIHTQSFLFSPSCADVGDALTEDVDNCNDERNTAEVHDCLCRQNVNKAGSGTIIGRFTDAECFAHTDQTQFCDILDCWASVDLFNAFNKKCPGYGLSGRWRRTKGP